MKIRIHGMEVNVPEGVDVQEFAEKIDQQYMADKELYDPTKGMTGMEKFTAGVGQGMSNIGRNVANIVGIPGYSDEDLAEAAKTDAPLLETGAGQAGAITGEIAATAPLTLGIGGAASGVRAASKAAGGLSKARAMATAAPTQAALDAGLSAAIAGGPGERMENLAQGAALGGAMSAPFKLLHKAGKGAVVPKTTEARRVERMLGSQIPLSQSAKPGVMKQVYEGFVANMPGAGGKLRNQYQKAVDNWRHFIVEEAMPKGADRVFSSTDDIQTVLSKVDDLWAGKFDYGFKEVPMKFFDDTWNTVKKAANSKPLTKLWEKNKQAIGVPSLDKLAKMETMTGAELLSLKTELRRVAGVLRKTGNSNAAKQFDSMVDDVHNVMKRNLDPSGKGKGQFAMEVRDYFDNLPQFNKWQDVLAAAEKGDASRFLPKHLMKTTAKRAGRKGLSGGGVFNREAKNAVDALQDFPSRQGIFQSTAAMGLGSIGASGLMGGMAAGPIGGVVGAAAPFVVARVLARPGVQKILSEGTPFSRRLMKAIEKRPDLFTGVGDQGIKAAVLAAEKGDN